ncbi:MAG: hypothetical protein ABEJ43_04365 [Haloferacaceae archaeon]
MEVPSDPPECCPVCDTAYDSVSVHEAGLMVNLRDNERYQRVCFAPQRRDEAPAVEFYHHTHAQVREARGDVDAPAADVPTEE